MQMAVCTIQDKYHVLSATCSGLKKDQTFFEAVFSLRIFYLHLQFVLQAYFGYIAERQILIITFKYRKKLLCPADCLSFKRQNKF